MADYTELVKRLRDDNACISLKTLHEAADAIEELIQITRHYEDESKGWWLAACDAKERSEEQKATIIALAAEVEELRALSFSFNTSRWIPVEERLPEDCDDVLVTDGEDCAVGFWREDAKAWDSPNFGWLENRKEPPAGIKTVTHWMPLPEPPDHIGDVNEMVKPPEEEQ